MTIPTQAQAERAAALAGHNVPATCHTNRRCWSCCYCGQAFPKKRTAVGR